MVVEALEIVHPEARPAVTHLNDSLKCRYKNRAFENKKSCDVPIADIKDTEDWGWFKSGSAAAAERLSRLCRCQNEDSATLRQFY